MKKFGKVLLWFFFLPFMATIYIVKNNKMSKLAKVTIITIIWGVMLIAYAVSQTINITDAGSGITDQGGSAIIDVDKDDEGEPEEVIEVPKVAKEVQLLMDNGLSEEDAVTMFSKIEEIGAPVWDKNSTVLKEVFTEEDYLVSYTASNGMFTTTFVVHLLNGTVNEIRDDKMDIIFSDGSINPNYIYHRDINYDGLQNHAKEAINSVLKAPSTAEYPGGFFTPFEGWNIAKKENIVELSSYVDSQNSFGAMIRSEFFIQYRYDSGTFQPIYVVFDGQAVYDKR